MKIYLDDQALDPKYKRFPVDDTWTVVKTIAEFKREVERAHSAGEQITGLDLDNDLGEGENGELMEGITALRWLQDTYPEYLVDEKLEFNVHSENIVRKPQMYAIRKDCLERKQEVLDMKERPDPWAELRAK